MTPSSKYQPFMEVALRLAREAAQEVLNLKGEMLEKEYKEDHSPVTIADYASDRILREGLGEAFPDHTVLTEESGMIRRGDSDFVWLVDPLDGTRAYARGVPGFSVMVGLMEGGTPVLGVVADPMEGRVYEAIRGEGAFEWIGDKRTPLNVSARSEWNKMRIVTSTGFSQNIARRLTDEFGFTFIEPINSVGVKVAAVARQEADIYINHHGVHYWDTCAPEIILEEAGGIFTSIDGNPLGYALGSAHSHPFPTLATNGPRHQDLLDLLHGISEVREGKIRSRK